MMQGYESAEAAATEQLAIDLQSEDEDAAAKEAAGQVRLEKYISRDYRHMLETLKRASHDEVKSRIAYHTLPSRELDMLLKEGFAPQLNLKQSCKNMYMCLFAVECGILDKPAIETILQDIDKRNTIGPVVRPLWHVLAEASSDRKTAVEATKKRKRAQKEAQRAQ